jgi:hypothetical protein
MAGAGEGAAARELALFVAILAMNLLLARTLMPSAEGPVTVPYTLFNEVGKSNVQAIHSRGEVLTGRFKTPVTYLPESEQSAAPKGHSRLAPKPVSAFTTTVPSFVDRGLEALLIEHKIEISAKPIEQESSARGRRSWSGSGRRCSSSGGSIRSPADVDIRRADRAGTLPSTLIVVACK